MATVCFPTTVQPDIPESAMTPLEWLLLGAIFEQEREDSRVYFFSRDGSNDMPSIPVAEVRAALATRRDVESRTADRVRKALASERFDPDSVWLTLDFSVEGWAFIFQDIVRRCEALDHVAIITAWTSTRMDPDSVGGSAMVITADAVRFKATDELVDEMLADPGYGPVGVQPGYGLHALGRVSEDSVRRAVADLLASNPDPIVPADAVTPFDIRHACIAAVERLDLSSHVEAATQHAARMAIEAARSRARATESPLPSSASTEA